MEESHFYKTRIEGELCNLTLFDTGGAEEFSSLRDEIIPKGDCFLFVISQEDDLSNQWGYILKIFTKAQFKYWKKDIPPIIIVSNKSDSTNKSFTSDKFLSMVKTIDLPSCEVSAKTADGVKDCFKDLISLVLMKRNPEKLQSQDAKDPNKRKSLSQRLSISLSKGLSGLGSGSGNSKRQSGVFDMKLNF
jgi:GTPase SAR1 family protein